MNQKVLINNKRQFLWLCVCVCERGRCVLVFSKQEREREGEGEGECERIGFAKLPKAANILKPFLLSIVAWH